MTPATALVEPMMLQALRVVSNEMENADTTTLVLETENITFRAGQFMMLYAFGVGEAPISISGNPHSPGSLVHTVRRVGPVTDALSEVDIGETVGARGPYGTHWPFGNEGDDLVIVAGGLGMAPLRPAVFEAMANRDRYRSVSLVYGTRTPSDLLFKDDLVGWMASPAIDVAVTVDRATSEWWGDVGLVTALFPRVDFRPENTTALICGPEVMMKVVARNLRDLGVPASNTWLSLERNMKCAIGFCGHCQLGADFLCKDGPVLSYERLAPRLGVDEL